MYHHSISNLIRSFCEQTPSAPAIQGMVGAPLSYERLYDQICSTVIALNRIGVRCNDRVAIALPNGPDMAVAFLAIASGAACAPLNPAYRAKEFDFYLADLQAKALILPAGSPSPAREVAQLHRIPILELASMPDVSGSFRLITQAGTDLAAEKPPTAPIFSEPEDIALVLHTSGTTARPKIVPLTHSNLCTSADNIRHTLRLEASDGCLNVMPLFHIHGLVGALLSSMAAGGRVICTPGFQAAAFFDWLERFSPTWYSAVPTIHQAVLEQASGNESVIRRHPLRFIRSSSAALPPKTMTALETLFEAPVIEAYGMTEAAHQMASNPLPPSKRKPGSVGLAAGPEITIMDGVGNFLAAGEVGEVVIQGMNVTSGYENNPDTNARAYTRGWFRTGDQGYVDADGYLYLQGRLKELINRGGEKIAPQEVDNVLMELAGIRQAVTFAVPHPTLGEDVATAVVLQSGANLSAVEMRQFLFGRLADFKVPSQIICVDEIPKGPTGKLQRIGLAEKLSNRLQAPRVAPRNDLEGAIATLFSDILAQEPPSIHDNFFTLGGDSLTGTQVINRLNAVLGLALPNVALFQHPTIAELAQAVLTEIDAESSGSTLALLEAVQDLSEEELQHLLYEG